MTNVCNHYWEGNPKVCTDCGVRFKDIAPKKTRSDALSRKVKDFKEDAEKEFQEALKKAIDANRHVWKRKTKTKKSRKTIRKILEMVSIGYPIDVSCGVNHVIYNTFNSWVRQDEALRSALDSALIAAERTLLNPIMLGAVRGNKEDTQWLLLHRWPHKYNVKVALDNPSSNDASLKDPTTELIAFITGGDKKRDRKDRKGKG